MRDPHVERLHYRFVAGPNDRFEAPPLSVCRPDFDVQLTDGHIEILLHSHYPTEEAAREAVAPMLEAWVMDSSLQHGVDSIRFEFLNADIIDRNPPPPGTPQTIQMTAAIAAASALSATVTAVHLSYPEPPKSFYVTPEVRRIWIRWCEYVRGSGEPISFVAQFCLTQIEMLSPSPTMRRKRAGRLLAIDLAVLKKLGELTSTIGDERTARKALDSYRQFTDREVLWMECAIKILIRRCAEFAARKHPLEQITMAHLPRI